MEEITGEKCQCGGDIVEEINRKFVAIGELPIDGPGSERQWANVSEGFFCLKCGTKYKFPPRK